MLHVYRFDLAGANFRPSSAQGRTLGLKPGDHAFLERDPDNQYDDNAVRVLTEGDRDFIGFVPREMAATIAPLLDVGYLYGCSVISSGNLKPTFEVWLKHPDHATE